MEDGVEIHFGEVEEILFHIAGDGVVGAVGAGHGVDEGGHAGFEHFEKGLAHGKLAGAGEDGMLQDVGDAGVVRGRGGDADGKEVFGIVAVQVQDTGSAGEVFQLKGRAAQGGDGCGFPDGEPVDHSARHEEGFILRHVITPDGKVRSPRWAKPHFQSREKGNLLTGCAGCVEYAPFQWPGRAFNGGLNQ